MSLKGDFVVQIFIPFVCYLTIKWVVFRDNFDILDTVYSFGLIFNIIIVVIVNEKIQLINNQRLAMVLFTLYAYTSLVCIHYHSMFMHFLPYVVLCVLWTKFWNFFDNSYKIIIEYIKLKWIKIFQIFLQSLLWLIFFEFWRTYGFDTYTLVSLSNYIFYSCVTIIGYTVIPKSNAQVELKRTQLVNEMNTIRFDIDHNQTKYVRDSRFPICQELYERRIGEDVMIQCKWSKQYVPIVEYEPKWSHNGRELVNCDRKKITSTRGKDNVETVTVFLIDKMDFGKYQLWISSTNDHSREYIKKRYMIASVVMTELNDVIRYVSVPVGNGLVFDYQVDYSFQTKVLSSKYIIESKLIGTTKLENISKILYEGCSVFSFYFLKTSIRNMDLINFINKPTLKVITNTEIRLSAFICTTESFYGKHSVHITREFYNETAKVKQKVTSPLGLYLIVLPAEPYITKFCNKNYEKYHTTSLKDIERSDLLGEVYVWLLRQVIELLLIAFIVFTLFNVLKYFILQVDQYVVSNICILFFKLAGYEVDESSGSYLEQLAKEYAYAYEYDVLILSAEDDRAFITENEVCTCLEEKGFKVCFPERDFNAGASIFNLYSEAFKNSGTVIVVYSQAFVEDKFKSKTVLEDFIMSFTENEQNIDKKMFLIKKDEGQIQPFLMNRKYPILDTTQLNITRSCIRKKVCAWMAASVARFRLDTKDQIWLFIIIICISISITCTLATVIEYFFGVLFLSMFISNVTYFDNFGFLFTLLAHVFTFYKFKLLYKLNKHLANI